MNNEPVAYRWKWDAGLEWHYADYYTDRDYFKLEPLYTHPVELTDDEIQQVLNDFDWFVKFVNPFDFARAILRKASEK